MTIRNISFFCLLLVASSCEQNLVLSSAVENILVVNSSFSPDQPWTVFVSKPKSLLDNSTTLDVVEGAVVSIFEGSEKIEEMIFDGSGLQTENPAYRTSTRPEAGKTYNITVEAKGYPTATAIDRVPLPNFEIMMVEHINTSTTDQYFVLKFKDLTADHDYYQVSVRRNTYSKEDSTHDSLSLLEMEYIPIKVDDFNPIFGSTIETEGFQMINGKGFIIDDETFDSSDNSKMVPLKFDDLTPHPNPDFIYSYQVEVRAISLAYYEYQKSATDQKTVDQNPLANPVVIKSNITDGEGNFTGYVCKLSREIIVK